MFSSSLDAHHAESDRICAMGSDRIIWDHVKSFGMVDAMKFIFLDVQDFTRSMFYEWARRYSGGMGLEKMKSRVEWNNSDQCIIIVFEDFENGLASTWGLRSCKAEVCWKFATIPPGEVSSSLRKRCLHLDCCHARLSKYSWIQNWRRFFHRQHLGKSFFKILKVSKCWGSMWADRALWSLWGHSASAGRPFPIPFRSMAELLSICDVTWHNHLRGLIFRHFARWTQTHADTYRYCMKIYRIRQMAKQVVLLSGSLVWCNCRWSRVDHPGKTSGHCNGGPCKWGGWAMLDKTLPKHGEDYADMSSIIEHR